jgi:bifunctional DNA-binding transcriptional regulator/antitoxin component of YhaV-PrlF toxin-antitoxin module
MITDTSILDIGGSLYVLIPKPQREYFEIAPGSCTIEDNGKNKATLRFR